MTNNNSKCIIASKIVKIRQLFFSQKVTSFYQQLMFSVAFNISSSHANISLTNKYFLHE